MTYTDKALLLAEWGGANWRAQESACPCCLATEINGKRPERHDADCMMDLALSERGFCTQEERNRARVFISAQAETMPPPSKEQ